MFRLHWRWTVRPRTCGVNFIGGYSALVQKGMTLADEKLLRSIPEALDRTELVCSVSMSVPLGPVSIWTR